MSPVKLMPFIQSSSQVTEEDYSCSSSHSLSETDIDMEMLCCHSVQDSLLSSDSRFTDYRGILNWIIILLILTHAHLFLENFIQHGFLIDLWKVLEHLTEDNYNWPSLYLILAANVFAITALTLEKSQDKGRLSSGVGHCLHLGNLWLLTFFPAAVILHNETSISTGGAMFSLCSYTILGLKLYSYQEVNSWYRHEQVRHLGTKNNFIQESGENVDHLSLNDLYYFLLAPTLCYQRDFPHTPRVRINFLLQRLMEMVILIQLMVGIMQQWIAPIFQRSEDSFSNMDFTTRIEHLVELVTPTHFLWLIFFLFSHSYLNFIAELLCFGDRRFYGDWWNADTLNSLWRNWNIPFHKWSRRHLYRPLVRREVPHKQAEILVFMLSAAVFEYNIALPLHSCRLWIFLTMIFELLVAVFLDRYFTGNYGNGLVWLCLLLGPPLAVMTYCHDHYMTHRGHPPPGSPHSQQPAH